MTIKTSEQHLFAIRVYYEDTDAGGVVYYANYLKYAERARTEWLRSRGIEQQILRDQQNVMFVVRHINVDYLAPAKLDDKLEITTIVTEWRRASLCLTQNIIRETTVLVSLQVKIACVNTELKPIALPKILTQQLQGTL